MTGRFISHGAVRRRHWGAFTLRGTPNALRLVRWPAYNATGLVTSLTGPIGFVGLIVPHALRLRWGADHRVLLPCSIFLGGAFLCICDTLARTVLAPTEIPVGVLTALCGGPFFLWLLRSRRRSLWM